MREAMISVIVVTYKHGQMLFETIDSILAQDYPNIQLIVAEDGNLDFSVDAIEEYIRSHKHQNLSDFKVLHSTVNQGTVRNLNSALNYATGDYIKSIAGDDVYPNSQVFSQQVAYLEEHPEADIVVGNSVECDAALTPLTVNGFGPEKREDLLKGSRKKLLRYVCRKNPGVLSTQACCYRRVFFAQVGQYDERYRLIEDLPMTVRIVTENRGIGYIDCPCVNHRGSVGISTSNKAFDIGRITYYEDLLKYYENSLMPIEKTVGKCFVRLRYQLIRFRIDYSKASNEKRGILVQMTLILKNLLPIFYYSVNNIGRIGFYFGSKKG